MNKSGERTKLQFGLKAVFATVTAAAFLLALMFYVRDNAANPILIFLVPIGSALAITGLAYGAGAVRAFCIGASVPLGMMLIFVTSHLPEVFLTFRGLAFTHRGALSVLISNEFFVGGFLLSLALGYLCSLFHWVLQRKARAQVCNRDRVN